MRDCSYSAGWIRVKKGSNAAICSLAVISNSFLEQLAKGVTKGKTSLDLVHSTCFSEVAAEEYSTTGASMHSNSTFLQTKQTPTARKKIHRYLISAWGAKQQ